MVRLNSPLQKAEIYRNVSKLAKNRTWKGVYLNDDLPPSQQAERRDARSLIALARSKGLASKQKGSAVIIEGVRYPPRDFPALPHGLSLEAAKTVQVTGGLAFQGHHSYLSNMYITPVPYSGNTFDSAESAYQCTCAKFHGNEALAAQIQVVQDPYAAKKLSQKIQCNAEWNAKKISIMRDIVKAKFDANDTIRDKLLQTKGRLYEATTDRVFGCGFTLGQRDQIRANSITAGNKLGELLVEYRDTHKKADTSMHDQ